MARVYGYGGVRAAEEILLWCAFFDVVGWRWTYRSADLGGFTPQLQVTIPALDCAWVSVQPAARTLDGLVVSARRDLERGRFEGMAVGLAGHPLDPDHMGAMAVYPRPRWVPLTPAMAGLQTGLRALWREAMTQLHHRSCGVESGFTPEKLGGTMLPDWRSRGEALSRRWAAPDQSRDWGLLVAELALESPLLAGVIAGASKGELVDEYLNVWFPSASIRTAVLRSMGAEPRRIVQKCLGVQLQILIGD